MPQLNFNALTSGGPQSVYEGFMQGQEIRNKLVQQEQARQLTDIQRQHATLQLQNATREQQAADEESAAWKAGAGDPKVVLQQLQQRGLGKLAMTLQGQLTKQQTDKLAQQKAMVDLVKHSANQVFANPGSALQILQSFGQRTGVDMSDDIAEVQRLGGDLEAVKRWAAGQAFEADKLRPELQTIDQNDKKTVQGFDPVTGQPVGPGTVYSVGMNPAQVAQNRIAQGQLGLQERRFAYQKEQDVKEALDKRMSPAAAMESLPPKELQRREATYPQATAAIKGMETKSESFIADLEKLKNHPGLPSITGLVAGRVTGLTSEGRAAKALYDKITAKGGFQALQDIRSASTTGGGLGSISNQEGKQLVASFAAIDRTQDADDVKAAIDQAIHDIRGSKTRMRDAYDTMYQYKSSGPSGGGSPTPSGGVIEFGSLK